MNKTLFIALIAIINASVSLADMDNENQIILTQVINGANVYGEKWQDNFDKMNIEQAVAEHEMIIGENMIFTGNISKVCQKAGCWMILESNGHFARIDFNKHSFFIPKDTQGTAEVFGKLHSKTLDTERRKHIESESKGKLAEKIFEITATSVKIKHR